MAHSGFPYSPDRRKDLLATRAEAVAAYDAMAAARPLSPPPLPSGMPRVVSAGRLALLRDRKLGAID